MKWYIVVEGRRTEKKIYESWLDHAFHDLKQVERIEDMAHRESGSPRSLGDMDRREVSGIWLAAKAVGLLDAGGRSCKAIPLAGGSGTMRP